MKKGSLYGFMDIMTGEAVQAPQFTSVSIAEDGTIIAMIGKNAVYLDCHARPLAE